MEEYPIYVSNLACVVLFMFPFTCICTLYFKRFKVVTIMLIIRIYVDIRTSGHATVKVSI